MSSPPLKHMPFLYHLILGHLQEVKKMCARQSTENLLRLGHYPGNPIPVAQHVSLKNNSFYFELYRNPSAPCEVKSNTQWLSKAPGSTKRSDLPATY